jgi:hypothetical protein
LFVFGEPAYFAGSFFCGSHGLRSEDEGGLLNDLLPHRIIPTANEIGTFQGSVGSGATVLLRENKIWVGEKVVEQDDEFAQEFDEGGVRRFVVVGDAEDDKGLVGELGGEMCARASGVFFSP